jgi:hypothetical protein
MRFSKEDKARHLACWRESGQSISAYVKEHGLVRWTFHKWLRADRECDPCFVEIPSHAITLPVSVSEIFIEKGDVRIRIPLGLSLVELRTVVLGLGITL